MNIAFPLEKHLLVRRILAVPPNNVQLIKEVLGFLIIDPRCNVLLAHLVLRGASSTLVYTVRHIADELEPLDIHYVPSQTLMNSLQINVRSSDIPREMDESDWRSINMMICMRDVGYTLEAQEAYKAANAQDLSSPYRDLETFEERRNATISPRRHDFVRRIGVPSDFVPRNAEHVYALLLKLAVQGLTRKHIQPYKDLVQGLLEGGVYAKVRREGVGSAWAAVIELLQVFTEDLVALSESQSLA